MTTGHGSYSASFNNVVRFAVPDKRCKTCRNWQTVMGGEEVANVCFLDGAETNSDWHCDAWHQKNKWKGRK